MPFVAALVIGLEEPYETTMALALPRKIHENEAVGATM